MIFFICITRGDAESRQRDLEQSGYSVKIHEREGQFHVDAKAKSFDNGNMGRKKKGTRKGLGDDPWAKEIPHEIH